MSKLFKLKKWLTIPEAAKHLSGVLEETVTESDVLRLSLDRHIELSVNFINWAAGLPAINGGWEGGKKDVKDQIELINGVYQLVMVAGGTWATELVYQNHLGGPEVTAVNPHGIFVIGYEKPHRFFQLRDPLNNYSRLMKLPQDAVLVVGTSALREFESLVCEPSTGSETVAQTITIRDDSLLAVIAALLAQWPNGKHPTGKDLERAAQSIGINISDDTIRKALKAAKEIAPSLSA